MPAENSVSPLRPLRALILEGEPSDAELLIRLLRQAGFAVEGKHVTTKAAYMAALETPPELILAEFSLPQLDGLEALALMQQRELDIPFILISGEVGEEQAVEFIKRGADDYLLKDRLGRLGVAVSQALSHKALRDQRKHDEQERDQLLHDLSERVKELSTLHRVFNRLHNDERTDDKLFQDFADSLPPGWQYPQLAATRLTIDDREFTSDGFRETAWMQSSTFRTTYGQQGKIEVAYRQRPPCGDAPPFPVEEEALLRTVTELLQGHLERRQAQRLLQRDAQLLANVQDAMVVVDVNGIVTFWNAGASSLFGWSAEEMLGQPLRKRVPQAGQAWLDEHMRQAVSGKEWSGEHLDWRKDGTRVWLDSRVTSIVADSGQVLGLLGISRDISQRKESEAALKSSEQRYRDLVETTQDLIWAIDSTGQITFVNEASRSVYGWEPEEVLGKSFLEFIAPEYRERDRMVVGTTLQTGEEIHNHETHVCRKDGVTVVLNTNARVLRDAQGTIIGCSGISRDLTQIIEATKELQEQQVLLSNAQRLANIGSWDCDYQTQKLKWSEQTFHIFGLQAENFDGSFQTFADRIHPADRERVVAEVAAADAAQTLLQQEFRIVRPNGEVRLVRERSEVVFDAAGKALRRLGMVSDVTEREQYIAALRESEERFQLAVHGSAAGVWDWDVLSNKVYYSPRYCNLLGYATEDFPPLFASFFEAIHPTERRAVSLALDEHFADRQAFDVECRLQTQAGAYRWFNARGAVLRDPAGQP
ncbi:MAG: PAS domain S-box protein, partial [Planctomycetales bacterium]|nr:PAS domain S-box protein [Planctomycetales bacterium]